MMPSRWRVFSAGASVALPLLLLGGGRAAADHGLPVRTDSLGPVVVGILAGLLTLATGIAIAVIVRLLTKKTPRAE
jgi:hypothetical protein